MDRFPVGLLPRLARAGQIAHHEQPQAGEGGEEQHQAGEAQCLEHRWQRIEHHRRIDHEAHQNEGEIAVRGGGQADDDIAERHDGAGGHAGEEAQDAECVVAVDHGAGQVAGDQHPKGGVAEIAPVDRGDQQHHQQALHRLAGILQAGDIVGLAEAEAQLMHHAIHEGRLHDHGLRADQMNQQHAEQQPEAVDFHRRRRVKQVVHCQWEEAPAECS